MLMSHRRRRWWKIRGSRPSRLHPVGELGQCPLVVDHTELPDVTTHLCLVLIGLAYVRIERLASTVPHLSNCVGYNTHFLKVDHIINERLVALVCKRHIFEEEGHKGDDWRLQFGNSKSVGPVVSRRVHHAFKLSIEFLKLGGEFLPCLAQPADSRVTHPHNDGKERIQVLKFPTMCCYLNELLEELDSLAQLST